MGLVLTICSRSRTRRSATRGCGLSDAASRHGDERLARRRGLRRRRRDGQVAQTTEGRRVAYSFLVRLPRAVKRALDMAERRAGQANGSWGARYECTLPRADRCSPDWCRQLEWAWKCRLQPVCARLGALALALLSATVVYSQVTLAAGCAQPNFSLFSAIVHYNQECDKPVWTPLLDALVLLPLTYICLSTLYGLFKVQIFSTYVLTKGASDGYSMLTCALLMCRLSSPIAYNFLRITCVDDGRCARFFEDACSAALTDDACAAAGTIEVSGTVCTWDAANQTQPCFLPQNVADSGRRSSTRTSASRSTKPRWLESTSISTCPPYCCCTSSCWSSGCTIACVASVRRRSASASLMRMTLRGRFMVQGRHTLREVRAIWPRERHGSLTRGDRHGRRPVAPAWQRRRDSAGHATASPAVDVARPCRPPRVRRHRPLVAGNQGPPGICCRPGNRAERGLQARASRQF